MPVGDEDAAARDEGRQHACERERALATVAVVDVLHHEVEPAAGRGQRRRRRLRVRAEVFDAAEVAEPEPLVRGAQDDGIAFHCRERARLRERVKEVELRPTAQPDEKRARASGKPRLDDRMPPVFASYVGPVAIEGIHGKGLAVHHEPPFAMIFDDANDSAIRRVLLKHGP